MDVARLHLPAFTTRELSNLAWALATLHHVDSTGFLDGLVDAALPLLNRFYPQVCGGQGV